MKFAMVRHKRFKVWDEATKDDIAKMLNEYNRGIIVVCPRCRKIDINPYTHFDNCDPEAQADRVAADEVFWK